MRICGLNAGHFQCAGAAHCHAASKKQQDQQYYQNRCFYALLPQHDTPVIRMEIHVQRCSIRAAGHSQPVGQSILGYYRYFFYLHLGRYRVLHDHIRGGLTGDF